MKNSFLCMASMVLVAAALGCHSAPVAPQATIKGAQTYPARPAVPAPPFKLFHQTTNSITLVTEDDATDDEVVAILYELRDATQSHDFAALHLPQKFVDARDPIVWFHVYRGSKCASEKYSATLPCGASYHAAADYTLGGFTDRNHEDGVLFHGEDHETHLWNSDALHKL